MTEPTDVSNAPELAPEPAPDPKPAPIDVWAVPGSADLPDDVKNGEIPGEDDPDVQHEDTTEEPAP